MSVTPTENKKLATRASYVQNEINKRPKKVTEVVAELSKELFLSERTIWRAARYEIPTTEA